MPSSFRDPKTLPDWIELDYFSRPRRIRRLRRLLSWLVVLACVGLAAATLWPRARVVYESRPVSSAHTMFNNQCGVCHTDSFQTLQRVVSGGSKLHSVKDETCLGCHEGPPHQPAGVAGAPNCVSCHEEHRGKDRLARIADQRCDKCHADLKRLDSQPSSYAEHIHGFNVDHPPLGAWRQKPLDDPGTLKFNHEVHLSLGSRNLRNIERPLADLDQQQCSYCHQPDQAGRTMKPINYELHCKQCHRLSIQPSGNFEDLKIRPAYLRFASEPVPHPGATGPSAGYEGIKDEERARKGPEMVMGMVRERFVRFYQANRKFLGEEEPEWVIPGRREPVAEKEYDWVEKQLTGAERAIFGTKGDNSCSWCHTPRQADAQAKLPEFLPTSMRKVWYPHSVFSHERHRMLACTECHSGAPGSRKSADVSMPEIEDCKKCHNPQVGARVECIECHRYHNRARESLMGKLTISEVSHRP